MELYAEQPIELQYLGLIPQIYFVQEKKLKLENELDQRIYDICVKTLKLSMMEHYVDTPWREQCLYAFDSRNQMLCGYYAFENGNAEYARANKLTLVEFLPDYKRYGRAAPLVRNREIVDYADRIIIFWNGSSRGTLSVIEYAKAKEKPYEVIICE